MTVRDQIAGLFGDIARSQGKKLAPLQDDLPLMNSGLDSLCLAIIVACLDQDLGFDPFSSDENVAMPTTFGQFVSLYERVIA